MSGSRQSLGTQADPVIFLDDSDDEPAPPVRRTTRAARSSPPAPTPRKRRANASHNPVPAPAPAPAPTLTSDSDSDALDLATQLNKLREREKREAAAAASSTAARAQSPVIAGPSVSQRGGRDESEPSNGKGKQRDGSPMAGPSSQRGLRDFFSTNAEAGPSRAPPPDVIAIDSDSDGPPPLKRRRMSSDLPSSQKKKKKMRHTLDGFYEDTRLGSWGNPEPMGPPLRKKPKPVQKPPSPPGPKLGEWGNFEPLEVIGQPPSRLAQAAQARSEQTASPARPSPARRKGMTARKSTGGKAPKGMQRMAASATPSPKGPSVAPAEEPEEPEEREDDAPGPLVPATPLFMSPPPQVDTPVRAPESAPVSAPPSATRRAGPSWATDNMSPGSAPPRPPSRPASRPPSRPTSRPASQPRATPEAGPAGPSHPQPAAAESAPRPFRAQSPSEPEPEPTAPSPRSAVASPAPEQIVIDDPLFNNGPNDAILDDATFDDALEEALDMPDLPDMPPDEPEVNAHRGEEPSVAPEPQPQSASPPQAAPQSRDPTPTFEIDEELFEQFGSLSPRPAPPNELEGVMQSTAPAAEGPVPASAIERPVNGDVERLANGNAEQSANGDVSASTANSQTIVPPPGQPAADDVQAPTAKPSTTTRVVREARRTRSQARSHSKSESIEEVVLTPPGRQLEAPIEISDDEAEVLIVPSRVSRRQWERLFKSAQRLGDGDGLFKGRESIDHGELAPLGMIGNVARRLDAREIDRYHKIVGARPIPNNLLHCKLFETYMSLATAIDEPLAPSIGVINNIDGPPPDFEFQYSNQMLYTDKVPEPELGQGCGCEGPCDPRSTTCLCVKRQQLYFYNLEGYHGFQYNEDGTVKNHECAIWECGPNCGCPPECMNRVIQRGRTKDAEVDLFKTRLKGWGVKARREIKKGTFIGIYSGELVTEAETEVRGRVYEKIGRTYLFDLDGYHIANPPAGLEQVDPRAYKLAMAVKKRALEWKAKEEMDRDHTDPFEDSEDASDAAYSAYSVDAFHYGFTRYINHSCNPNLVTSQAYVKDVHPERPLLVIFARYDIRAGEELCISYKGLPDDDVIETPLRGGAAARGRRKNKTSVQAHVSPRVARRTKGGDCKCGSRNCDGNMFPG